MRHRARRAQGFTLVEIVLAAAIGLCALTALISAVSQTSQHASAQALTTRDDARGNRVTQLIQEQFRDQAFAGFQAAGPQGFSAVFTTGPAIIVGAHKNLHTLNTLSLPGVTLPIGSEVLVTAANGAAKVLTVTSQPLANHYSFNCATGLPSTGEVRLYPARTMTVNTASGRIVRVTRGVTSDLGPSEALTFRYVYQTPSGTLVADPQGAPANFVPGGTLAGILPTIQRASGIDRAALIPTTGKILRQVLSCTQMGLTTVNEGRLNVTIEGLPADVSAATTVNGPDASVNNAHPTATTTYQPVNAGQYTLNASDVTTGGQTYTPTVRGSPATLHNTWGDAYLMVSYRLKTGTIVLTVGGLPAGVTTTVRFTPSGGGAPVTRTVPNGTVAVDLPPGTYTVTADAVSSGGQTYNASVSLPTVTVTSGSSTAVTVTYAASCTTGTVNVTLSGVPGNTGTTSVLRNTSTGASAGSYAIVNGTSTFTGLSAGSYTTTPATVNWGGTPYYPSPGGANFTVVGCQTTNVGFTYTYTPAPEPPTVEQCQYGALRCIEPGPLPTPITVGTTQYPSGTDMNTYISTPYGSMTIEQYLENYNPAAGNMPALLNGISWTPNPTADGCAVMGCNVPISSGSGSEPPPTSEPEPTPPPPPPPPPPKDEPPPPPPEEPAPPPVTCAGGARPPCITEFGVKTPQKTQPADAY